MGMMQYCILPDINPYPSRGSTLQIYNYMLAWGKREPYEFDKTVEVWLENEALFRYCREKRGIADPSMRDINRLIAEQSSSITYARRFGGPGFKNFIDLQNTIVVYPLIKYLLTSRSTMPAASPSDQELIDLTKAAYKNENILAKQSVFDRDKKYKPESSRHFGPSAVLYRHHS